MITRILLVLIAAAACVGAPAAEPRSVTTHIFPIPKPEAAAKPVEPFSSKGLEVAFSIDSAVYAVDDFVSGQYTIKCVGPAGFDVYNPLYNPLTYRPGEIRVFDSSGKLVWNMLEFTGGSWFGKETEIMVYPGDFMGSHVSVRPPVLGMLPPGDYKAQFVLYSYVVIGQQRLAKMAANHRDPSTITAAEKEFETGKQVIAASKLVQFKIVQKPEDRATN